MGLTGVFLTLAAILSVSRIDKHATHANFIIPGLPRERYEKLGDINIAFLFSMTEEAIVRNKENYRLCSDVIRKSSIRYPQMVNYVVEKINKESPLPRDLKLGFVVLDDCSKDAATYAQSLSFVPISSCSDLKDEDGRSCVKQTASNELPFYSVIAVVGARDNDQTISMARILGPLNMTAISNFASDDQLSNPKIFPHFMRTVPPDKYRYQAIVSVINHFNWTYISVLYKKPKSSQSGFDKLRQVADQKICFATTHEISENLGEKEAEEIKEKLLNKKKAKVVLIISNPKDARMIISTTRNPGTFIWFATDEWADELPQLLIDLKDSLLESLAVLPLDPRVPEFENWFSKLNAESETDHWYKRYWEFINKCSLKQGTCKNKKRPMTVESLGRVSHVIDTVYMVVNATRRLLTNGICKDQTSKDKMLECITSPRVLTEIKKVKAVGKSGPMEYNEDGDRTSSLTIQQAKAKRNKVELETIAYYNPNTRKLTLKGTPSWSEKFTDGGLTIPKSICSEPCGKHETQMTLGLACCWKCLPCEGNQKLNKGAMMCVTCPARQWADENKNFTECKLIEPDSLRWNSVTGIIQAACAIGLLVVCLMMAAFFLVHRKWYVIQASNIGLWMLMLLGMMLSSLMLLLLLLQPNDNLCRVIFVMLTLSFPLIFAPLLVRLVRIFSVVNQESLRTLESCTVSMVFQTLFASFLVLLQGIYSVVLLFYYLKWTILFQSSPNIREVELTCDLPTSGMIFSLAYTCPMVLACIGFAFKTRQLVEQFVETSFISASSITTLILLMCFSAAYVVSSSYLLKFYLLSLGIVINNTVILVLIFGPTVYVIYKNKSMAIDSQREDGITQPTQVTFAQNIKSKSVPAQPIDTHNKTAEQEVDPPVQEVDATVQPEAESALQDVETAGQDVDPAVQE